MILNPHTKLVIFEEESWANENAENYSTACCRRFGQQYKNSKDSAEKDTSTSSHSKHDLKRSAYTEDPEFHQLLIDRSSQWCRNDYDRYIEIPNDPHIRSGLGWWKDHHGQYPDLGMMARDVLAVPASGCAVERQFSISGRIAVWQRNRLSSQVISDSMIYKGAPANTRNPLPTELKNTHDMDTTLPINEKEGTIPDEWTSNWWLSKLDKCVPRQEVIELFQSEDDEDLYG